MLLRVCAVLLMIGQGFLAAGGGPSPSNPAPAAGTPAPSVTAPRPAAGAAYENKLVRRPGGSIEDGKVYLVQNGKKRWVVNASWFAANGYKFPDQVHQISAAELDAIPSGDPIQ
jgi:hypothetical protein